MISSRQSYRSIEKSQLNITCMLNHWNMWYSFVDMQHMNSFHWLNQDNTQNYNPHIMKCHWICMICKLQRMANTFSYHCCKYTLYHMNRIDSLMLNNLNKIILDKKHNLFLEQCIQGSRYYMTHLNYTRDNSHLNWRHPNTLMCFYQKLEEKNMKYNFQMLMDHSFCIHCNKHIDLFVYSMHILFGKDYMYLPNCKSYRMDCILLIDLQNLIELLEVKTFPR